MTIQLKTTDAEPLIFFPNLDKLNFLTDLLILYFTCKHGDNKQQSKKTTSQSLLPDLHGSRHSLRRSASDNSTSHEKSATFDHLGFANITSEVKGVLGSIHQLVIPQAQHYLTATCQSATNGGLVPVDGAFTTNR